MSRVPSSPTCVEGGGIWSGAGSCNAVGGRGRRVLQQTAQQMHCLLQQDLITAGQGKLQPPRPLCVRVCECGDIMRHNYRPFSLTNKVSIHSLSLSPLHSAGLAKCVQPTTS